MKLRGKTVTDMINEFSQGRTGWNQLTMILELEFLDELGVKKTYLKGDIILISTGGHGFLNLLAENNGSSGNYELSVKSCFQNDFENENQRCSLVISH